MLILYTPKPWAVTFHLSRHLPFRHIPYHPFCECPMSDYGPSDLTFAALCQLEPKLADLNRVAHFFYAREKRRWKYCCGNRALIRDIKPRLVELVGNLRRPAHPILSTSAAYDVAYHHLAKMMPECRECSCW